MEKQISWMDATNDLENAAVAHASWMLKNPDQRTLSYPSIELIYSDEHCGKPAPPHLEVALFWGDGLEEYDVFIAWDKACAYLFTQAMEDEQTKHIIIHLLEETIAKLRQLKSDDRPEGIPT